MCGGLLGSVEKSGVRACSSPAELEVLFDLEARILKGISKQSPHDFFICPFVAQKKADIAVRLIV